MMTEIKQSTIILSRPRGVHCRRREKLYFFAVKLWSKHNMNLKLEADLGLLHLGCCSSPRSPAGNVLTFLISTVTKFHKEKFERLGLVTNFVIVQNSKKYFVLVKTAISTKFLHPYINFKTASCCFKTCE